MDEKKVYDYKGTVTISTEEYRDLIEENVSLNKDIHHTRMENWEKRSTIEKLEKENAQLREMAANLTRWKDSKEELRLAYKLFLLEEAENADA